MRFDRITLQHFEGVTCHLGESICGTYLVYFYARNGPDSKFANRHAVANPLLASHTQIFSWLHAAFTLIEVCVSYICLLHWSSLTYFCVRGSCEGNAHVSP